MMKIIEVEKGSFPSSMLVSQAVDVQDFRNWLCAEGRNLEREVKAKATHML